jgi:hypothetical protein
MHRHLAHIFAAAMMLPVLTLSVSATPNCLRGMQPYRMADDTVSWAMAIAPGADCVQGLRWSTMQIEQVVVATPPSHGTLVLVGPGFRYFANLDAQKSADRFTLVVSGKNRHDRGKSTVEIIVGRPLGYMASSLIEWCDNCRT